MSIPKGGGYPNALSQVAVANSELPRRRQEARAWLVLWARLALKQVMSRLAGRRCWQGSVAVKLTISISKSSYGVLSSGIIAAIETAFQMGGASHRRASKEKRWTSTTPSVGKPTLRSTKDC